MFCSVVSWSEATSEPPKVVRTPSVLYILTPQTACTFSTSQPPKVVRTPGVFNILTSKCATTVCTFVTSEPPKVARTCSVLHFDFQMCFVPQRRALFRHLNLQKWREHVVFCTFSLPNVLRATTTCTFLTSQLPKVVRTWCVLYILTSKCASRHNGVHFFDISTSKSGSGPGVFCKKTFWLQNVLRATTACIFSTSQLPKVVRTPGVFNILTSKCASRHNGVQLFISHLPRCLRTRRFSEPTLQPSGATKPRKNTVFRDFPTFSRTCIFFLLIFSLLTLLPADSFFISPYCRKFDFQTSFDYTHICINPY